MENIEQQQMIKKLIEWVECSATFVKGQLPDYIEQYMRAATIKSWTDIILCSISILFLISIMLFCWYKNSQYEKSYDSPFGYMFGSFMPLVLIVPCMATMIYEIHNLINIYVSPKVYILSHLNSLIK